MYTSLQAPTIFENQKDKHPNEKILLMQNSGTTVLLHETSGKTLFSSPRKYEVVDGKGHLQDHGYVVMNNIPVSEEGRPVFEHRFKKGPVSLKMNQVSSPSVS